MEVHEFKNDSPTPTNPSVTDAVRLAFDAGRLAEAKGLGACLMIHTSEVDAQPPSGPPLVVTAQRGGLSEDLLRSIAALHGASREVLVVSMDPVKDGSSWLAEGLVHVVGIPISFAPVEATPEPTPPEYDLPPLTPPPPQSPVFSNLRLFGGVRPDPIGEAARQWGQVRQNLRWHLEEVPLPDEGAYAWFGVWPLEQDGPAALIRFQPYEFAGVQVLQIESAIGQAAATAHDLERVGSPAQERFAAQVTMQCEADILQVNSSAAWISESPPAVVRGIILDDEPPLPLANSQARIAARMTVGSTGVYLHYLIPIASTFVACVGAAVDALVSSHRKLWQLDGRPSGHPAWPPDMHFTSAAELVLHAALGQVVCGACGTAGLTSDEYCGWCGARWR